MATAREEEFSNLVKKKPMIYFSHPCGNNQVDDRVRDEQATEGLMA